MNPANTCHLEGAVQDYPLYGPCWTRCTPRGRYQVRFWLGIPRLLAGEGLDVVLCAIEPRTAAELTHYQEELRRGRTVHLDATARSQAEDMPGESAARVIFVAEYCGFDGQAAVGIHPHRKPAATGKMAAAGDDSGAELPLNP